MEVQIRNIGNSLGIIIPRRIAEFMNFHVKDIVELEIDKQKKRIFLERKKKSLRENLLEGILASQEENLAFANGFDEIEGEI